MTKKWAGFTFGFGDSVLGRWKVLWISGNWGGICCGMGRWKTWIDTIRMCVLSVKEESLAMKGVALIYEPNKARLCAMRALNVCDAQR